MSTILNRRSWLKQSTIAAGGLLTTMAAIPKTFGSPAFGMKPINGTYNLVENYHIIAKERPVMKARLLANENPWGPSKKAIAAIAESAAMGNRYVYNSSVKMMGMLSEKEGVSTDHILLAPGSTDILEK